MSIPVERDEILTKWYTTVYLEAREFGEQAVLKSEDKRVIRVVFDHPMVVRSTWNPTIRVACGLPGTTGCLYIPAW